MRCLLILGSLFIISATYCLPSPCESNTDRDPIIVTDEPPVIQSAWDKTSDGPRTEIISNVSRNSSQLKTTSDTKSKEKVKTKQKKDGSTVTIIVDKTKTKNKTKGLTDSFDQTNHTILQGEIEEQDILTKEKQQRLKEKSVAKNVTREKIVTNPDGTIKSDTVKTKVSEKDKKSVKTKQSKTLLRTKKTVTTEAPECITITLPPTPPCETLTTTTEAPVCITVPPTRTTTTETPCITLPPKPPCETPTTTTEPPRLPCGCKRTTTTEKPEKWPCGHPKPTD
ncbi:mucin-2-like [Cydia strobilella]|uniref:mucin-2-like n=1 Tax=Cydia strobilella TaxID=1100964 RepID=UPI003007E6B7